MYSPLGDGSTDVSTVEQEVVGGRLSWNGKARNEFIGMEDLDLADSRDGESPGAQCLAAAYDRQFTDLVTGEEAAPPGWSETDDAALFPHLVDHPKPVADPDGKASNKWLGNGVAGSLDGASVNTGADNGVVSFWTLVAPWLLLVHGLAHVLEIACSDSFKLIPYFMEVFDVKLRALLRLTTNLARNNGMLSG